MILENKEYTLDLSNNKFTIKHIETCLNYSKLSTSEKRKCGSLLITPDNKNILSIGYNGTPTGYKSNLCEYIKKIVYKDGTSFPKDTDLNEDYEIDKNNKYLFEKEVDQLYLKTKPYVIHAEQNAILNATKRGIATNNCILYSTHCPCVECAKMIIQSGINTVIYLYEYKNNIGLNLLKDNSINVICIREIYNNATS